MSVSVPSRILFVHVCDVGAAVDGTLVGAAVVGNAVDGIDVGLGTGNSDGPDVGIDDGWGVVGL